MEGDSAHYAEALAVKDGKILFMGAKADAEKMKGDSTIMTDLEGKTLLPGFVDGHSHVFLGMSVIDMADLNSPPVGKINSIGDIISAHQEQKKKMNLSDTDWIIGTGYDPDLLEEKRHPTINDLDPAFPTNPVLVWHISGHMIVLNSAALKLKGINAKTPDPAGGTIVHKPGTKEPNGLLQENAVYMVLDILTKTGTPEETDAKVKRVFDYYTSCGITTAQDGLTMMDQMQIAQRLAGKNEIPIDFVILPKYYYLDTLMTMGTKFGEYHNRLKYGGMKVTLDGSPQEKTAFLSKPYLTPVPGCTHDCRGIASIEQDELNQLFYKCYKNNIQLYAHCNGDATTDMMIKGHQYAIRQLGDSTTDHRTVIVHSQVMRPDQLDAYKAYNLFPSYFTNHTFFWGDVHLANLGEERASFISPLNSSLKKGIKFANHTDYTVTPMNQLFTVWTAVNRVTRSGKILGPGERVPAYEALKAITINSAYMYFEEESKGSLKEGKLADLVILDQNPVKVDPMKIKDIQVMQTIKEGTTVYRK
jgi:predicted amidohydrolase YtcJ